MDIIKSYCGLALIKERDTYMCVNMYSSEVKAKGSQDECEKYYREYMDRVAERS